MEALDLTNEEKETLEATLISQINVLENEGNLVLKTTEEFNSKDEKNQNLIISNVVDILLKTNRTNILFTIYINADGELAIKPLDSFGMLSFASQESIFRKLSVTLRKMAELKEAEKIDHAEWLN